MGLTYPMRKWRAQGRAGWSGALETGSTANVRDFIHLTEKPMIFSLEVHMAGMLSTLNISVVSKSPLRVRVTCALAVSGGRTAE